MEINQHFVNSNMDYYIWNLIIKLGVLKKERYNEKYKKQLIEGYKICRFKKYLFIHP